MRPDLRHRTFRTRGIRRRGFALVDVILGGVMLSIGLAAIISLASRAFRAQTDGEKHMTAAWLCDEMLAMVVVEGPVNYPRLHETNGQFEAPFMEFAYDLEIHSQGNGLPYLVTATVSWEAGRGGRSVQVQTLVAERYDDPEESRVPEEPIDREERWYGEDEQTQGGANAG